MNLSSDTETSSTDVESERSGAKSRRSGAFAFKRSFTAHTVSESSDEESARGQPKPGPSSVGPLRLQGQPSRGGSTSTEDPRPPCRYGVQCYRKNASHLQQFWHPPRVLLQDVTKDEVSTESSPAPSPAPDAASSSNSGPSTAQDLGLFLTRVPGMASTLPELSLREILSPAMGSLEASAQFSFMFEADWMVSQYPEEFRSKPLLIVYGGGPCPTSGTQAGRMTNIRTMQARLDIQFGTHHSKMMLLRYKEGFRVVIHTANMIPKDWTMKTQGLWVSPLCPPLEVPAARREASGDSRTHFKRELLQYLRAYRHGSLDAWIDCVIDHDFTGVRAHLIASCPGRHAGASKNLFGHLRMRHVLLCRKLRTKCPPDFGQWSLIGQFSSIGSLGSAPSQWVSGEWLESLGAPTPQKNRSPQLVYPCVENVRLSLEGYPAGASLPYQSKTAKKQPWLLNLLHRWEAERSKRTQASPHIKTYCRASPGGHRLSWFLLTSANLSKAAWGTMEKGGSQLFVRSYELGVLLLPEDYDQDYFSTAPGNFPMPFDLPVTPYERSDRPWIMDLPYTKLPDRNGNMWVPS